MFTKRHGLRDLTYHNRLSVLVLERLELRRLRAHLATCYEIINGLLVFRFIHFYIC